MRTLETGAKLKEFKVTFSDGKQKMYADVNIVDCIKYVAEVSEYLPGQIVEVKELPGVRTVEELVDLLSKQILHWITKCGREMGEDGDLVDEAWDLIATDEEIFLYSEVRNIVRTSLVY